MNKLLMIGSLGDYKAYLNLNKEEAIKRFCKTEEIELADFNEKRYRVFEIEFKDEFHVYSAWVNYEWE